VTEGWSRTENQMAVVGRTMAQAPSAILEEVFQDVTQRPGQVVQNSVIAGGIGYGATILMRRAPVIGALVAGTALLAEGCRIFPKVSNFLDEAGNADTHAKRVAVARQGALGIGREGAMFVETLPAAGLGSKLAFATLEKSAFARNLSYSVAEKAEFPVRRALPEQLFFKGPGTKLKTSLMTGADSVDALGASRLLPTPKPFTVEKGLIVDAKSGRMSRIMSGTPEGVELGVVQKPGQISGHLQNPYVDAPGMMSVPDLRMVPKGSLSFINAGENTTFYIGKGRAPIAAGSEVQVQAVVLDHKMKEAFLHDYMALADTKTYGLTGLKNPVQLDYDAALKALQRVDYNNPWNTLSAISRHEPGNVSRMAGSLNLAPPSPSLFSRIGTKMNIGDGVPTFLRSTLTAANPLFQVDRSAKS
jgi:hypothetical protein